MTRLFVRIKTAKKQNHESISDVDIFSEAYNFIVLLTKLNRAFTTCLLYVVFDIYIGIYEIWANDLLINPWLSV